MCLIQWEKTIIYCKWAPASFRFHVLKMLGVPTPARFFFGTRGRFRCLFPPSSATSSCGGSITSCPSPCPPSSKSWRMSLILGQTVRRAGSDRKNRLVDGWPTPTGIECGANVGACSIRWVSITKLAACVKGLIQSQTPRFFFETQQLRMGLPRNTRPSQEATSFHTLSFVSGVGLIRPGWILTPGRKALRLMVCIRKCPNSLNSRS